MEFTRVGADCIYTYESFPHHDNLILLRYWPIGEVVAPWDSAWAGTGVPCGRCWGVPSKGSQPHSTSPHAAAAVHGRWPWRESGRAGTRCHGLFHHHHCCACSPGSWDARQGSLCWQEIGVNEQTRLLRYFVEEMELNIRVDCTAGSCQCRKITQRPCQQLAKNQHY